MIRPDGYHAGADPGDRRRADPQPGRRRRSSRWRRCARCGRSPTRPGVALHCDGARIWHAHVADGVPLADLRRAVRHAVGLPVQGARRAGRLAGGRQRRADRRGAAGSASGWAAACARPACWPRPAGTRWTTTSTRLADDHARARRLAEALAPLGVVDAGRGADQHRAAGPDQVGRWTRRRWRAAARRAGVLVVGARPAHRPPGHPPRRRRRRHVDRAVERRWRADPPRARRLHVRARQPDAGPRRGAARCRLGVALVVLAARRLHDHRDAGASPGGRSSSANAAAPIVPCADRSRAGRGWSRTRPWSRWRGPAAAGPGPTVATSASSVAVMPPGRGQVVPGRPGVAGVEADAQPRVVARPRPGTGPRSSTRDGQACGRRPRSARPAASAARPRPPVEQRQQRLAHLVQRRRRRAPGRPSCRRGRPPPRAPIAAPRRSACASVATDRSTVAGGRRAEVDQQRGVDVHRRRRARRSRRRNSVVLRRVAGRQRPAARVGHVHLHRLGAGRVDVRQRGLGQPARGRACATPIRPAQTHWMATSVCGGTWRVLRPGSGRGRCRSG